MNPTTSREFLPTLRELESRLSIPIPERVRILRELEFDLEQLRDRFMAEGFSVQEARARALEALVPGGPVLEQLDELHAPAYRRLMRNVGEDRLRLLERTALVVAMAVVLVVETLFLVRAGAFRVARHLLWPVLGAGALLFATIAMNAFRLWIKGDHRPPEPTVSAILGVAVGTLFVGLVTAFVDSYHVTGILSASPEMVETILPRWVLRNAVLLSVSIVIALVGALSWFIMTQWLTAVAAAHRDVLGLAQSGPSEGDENHG